MNELFLGIDGGGTSCRAWLADKNGRVIGRGTGPLANYHHAGWEGAETALHSTVEEAWRDASLPFRPAAAAFLGLAGVTSQADREQFKKIATDLSLAKKIEVDHDIRIALAGGLTREPGIALIAGTGSACYGRNAEGQIWQAGGWDAIADDVGSAYWLGLQAINRAVRATDGRDPETALKEIVFRHFHITAPEEIMQCLSGVQRREIACMAPLVVQASSADAAAHAICEQGADELALMISTVAMKLFREPVRAITAGSLGLAPDYQRRIREALRRRAPGITMVKAVLPPVAGAVLLALELADCLPSPSVIHSLSL